MTAVYCGCIYLLFPYTGGYFLVTNSLHSYLQSVSNGWQIAGLSVLLTVAFSLGCSLLAKSIDRYSRKHPRLHKSAAAQ
ncbi:MAG: hypothetical protein Q8903_14955 [Bacteroidota bacterium]|nr:hypothetical protein [Bacteroidota bacterium]